MSFDEIKNLVEPIERRMWVSNIVANAQTWVRREAPNNAEALRRERPGQTENSRRVTLGLQRPPPPTLDPRSTPIRD